MAVFAKDGSEKGAITEDRRTYHSASRARIIAELSGFLTLTQSLDGPER